MGYEIINEEINKVTSKEALFALKEEIGKAFSEREEVLGLIDEANSLKTKPFGYIKEAMEIMAPYLLSDKNGKKLLNNFIKEVRKNNKLNNIYNFYNNLESINEETNAVTLIREWKDLAGKTEALDDKDLKPLYDILAESYIRTKNNVLDILPKEERNEFYSLAETVYSMKEGKSNMGKYFSKINSLKENIIKAIKETPKMTDEEIFEEEKKKCIEALSEAEKKFIDSGDEKSSNKIKEYSEKLIEKKFKADSLNEDVKNFKELRKCFL